jgi:hypothetical protein
MDFGGTMRFNLGGTPLTIRARFDLEPTDFSYTVEHNQSGSFARYVQPMGPAFDITFEDSNDGVHPASVDWNGIMKGGPYNNVSVVGETMGVVWIFNGLQFMGRPKVDNLKGEVTGIQGQCPVGGLTKTTT